MNARTLFFSLATLGLAAGCATSGGSTTGASAPATHVKPADLKGAWTSAVCEAMAPNPDGSRTYFKRVFDIQETTWSLKFEAFGDAGCTARLFTARFEGPYTLVKDSEKVAGATEANFGFGRHYMTAHVQPVADWFQGAKCGTQPWKVGEEQETSATGCVFLRPVTACGMDHDVVKVQGNELFFGKRPADNDMCTPDKRPTQLTPVAVVRG
jgi:adenomatous polyposis coli down-regulated (APCDD)-like protein